MKLIVGIIMSAILVISGIIGVFNTYFVAPKEYFYISVGLIVLGLIIVLGLLLFNSIQKYKKTRRFWNWELGLFIFIFLPIAFFVVRFLFYYTYYTYFS
ncbi:hypothetical protein [Alkalihalobacillus sp. AL-G]|uniref:hypothetical protein n=1 Tax=Alkalihalobacillus sp. AL-G TaxID=2926399 RepID=UPI0027295980|nr:hypothetical protein [Alkalihalobacillus sp. AL-G]WLD94450.1 hypothetical protein MOJ78_06050 [Alkalihalobacillus sp. AL-G]